MPLLTLTNPAGLYILTPSNNIITYMNTFKIDFHINPYIAIYGPADMNKLTQFWFGNLFYHVPSFYYTLIIHSTHFQVKFSSFSICSPFQNTLARSEGYQHKVSYLYAAKNVPNLTYLLSGWPWRVGDKFWKKKFFGFLDKLDKFLPFPY